MGNFYFRKAANSFNCWRDSGTHLWPWYSQTPNKSRPDGAVLLSKISHA